jgi:hypothetical protein
MAKTSGGQDAAILDEMRAIRTGAGGWLSWKAENRGSGFRVLALSW